MFKVEVLIQPYKLDEVRAALEKFQVPGILVTEGCDYGASAAIQSTYRGSQYSVAIPRTRVEALVSSLQVDDVVEAVLQAARTAFSADDGTVVIYEVADAIRIRDGERIRFALQ